MPYHYGVSDGIIRGIQPGAHTDAFQRLRVSTPHILFSAVLDYDKREDLYAEKLTGGGTATHDSDKRAVEMTVTNSGDKVVRQSRIHFPYKTANSQAFLMTFCMGTHRTGIRMRVGAFNDSDGVFLCRDPGGVIGVVERSSVTGSVVDTRTDQDDWNVDKLDGTGPSRKTLDLTKTQILVIDYQWLGVGKVRYGFDMDGEIIVVHEAAHDNRIGTVYMRTGSLPVRYEVEATGIPADPGTMDHICASVLREGDTVDAGAPRVATNGVTDISVDADWTPMVGVRLASGYDPLLTVARSQLLNGGTSLVEVALVVNPTIAGGTPSWSAEGLAEHAVGTAAMSVSAWERRFDGGYVSGGGNRDDPSSSAASYGDTGIGKDVDGTSDEVWLIARTPSSSSDCLASISYIIQR